MKICVLVRVSLAVERHHGHDNAYKHLMGVAYSPEGYPTIDMGHGGGQIDVILEK